MCIALEKLFHGANFVVDTSLIIPCLAERLVPDNELQMQANELAAQREKRRDYLGAVLLVFLAVLVICGVWLVASGKVDTKNMRAAVSILAALATGGLLRRK
jgi:hypothetical protein